MERDMKGGRRRRQADSQTTDTGRQGGRERRKGTSRGRGSWNLFALVLNSGQFRLVNVASHYSVVHFVGNGGTKM